MEREKLDKALYINEKLNRLSEGKIREIIDPICCIEIKLKRDMILNNKETLDNIKDTLTKLLRDKRAILEEELNAL